MNEDITFLVALLALWYVFYVLIFIMLFIYKCIFSGSHTFPGQSLLLSTNVLNDSSNFYYVCNERMHYSSICTVKLMYNYITLVLQAIHTINRTKPLGYTGVYIINDSKVTLMFYIPQAIMLFVKTEGIATLD